MVWTIFLFYRWRTKERELEIHLRKKKNFFFILEIQSRIADSYSALATKGQLLGGRGHLLVPYSTFWYMSLQSSLKAILFYRSVQKSKGKSAKEIPQRECQLTTHSLLYKLGPSISKICSTSQLKISLDRIRFYIFTEKETTQKNANPQRILFQLLFPTCFSSCSPTVYVKGKNRTYCQWLQHKA